MDVLARNRDQLGMGTVAMLADDLGAVPKTRVQDDSLAQLEPVDSVAERLDHARRRQHRGSCGFGTEGSPCLQPDVEMIQ